MRCPYCNSGENRDLEEAFWVDVAARVLGLTRAGLEFRAAGVPMRKIAGILVGGDDPLAKGHRRPRKCPYCRSARLTVISDACLWTDILARVAGVGRVVFAVRGDGMRAIALAFVDSDDDKSKPRRRARRVTPKDSPTSQMPHDTPSVVSRSARARSTARGTPRGA